MFKQERYNKENQLISYRLICSGKDPNNGKHKNYTKTWKIPKYLNGKKEIEKELKKVEIAFEEEVEKISQGIHVVEQNIMFSDFAQEYLDGILLKNPQAYTYYHRVKQNLLIINPYFSKYSLKNITPKVVQDFFTYLANRTKTTEKVTVKSSFNELLKERNLSKIHLGEETGLNRLTIRIAGQVGKVINKTTAKTITEYLNVPIDKYFNIETIQTKYAKETNQSIRRTLSGILGKAQKMRLVEQNFASSAYVDSVGGTTKEKEVYSIEEAREFIKCLDSVSIKVKTILALLIQYGMRRCEVAGLTWSDIDFDNGTIDINKDALYVPTFGNVVKCTKTDSSKRVIPIIGQIKDILLEYKSWWQEQQLLHGDKWAYTDDMFLQENGNMINPTSISQWVNKYELNNGFKHVTTHGLRHTAITLMIYLGISPKVVAKIVGHANESITFKIYTHVTGKDFTNALEIYSKNLIG